MDKDFTMNNYNFSKQFNSFYGYLEGLKNSNYKIILYGAGTISRIILPYLNDNVIGICDQDFFKWGLKIDNLIIEDPNIITKDDFDVILITVLGREDLISDYLINQLKINENKIKYFKITDNSNFSLEETNYRIQKHQKIIKSSYNLPPYNFINKTEINLIFFIGIGDYLYFTPILKEIKESFPELIINGYVSKNFDGNNNPIVYQLLKQNPYINEVFFYNGKPTDWWRTYDFSDAIQIIKSNEETLYPVIYENNNPNNKHRVLDLFKIFGKDKNFIDYESIPKPIVYLKEYDYDKTSYLQDKVNNQEKDIIILHLEARSCTYSYADYNELIQQLIKEKYFVIFIGNNTKLEYEIPDFIYFDINIFSFHETIAFIKSIKNNKYFIAINSVMFPIASMLNIPMLSLFIFKNSTETRQTFYTNMKVLTVDKDTHDFLPKNSSILINLNKIKINNGFIVEYPVQLILKYFLLFFKNTI